jgi:hypothetical protein
MTDYEPIVPKPRRFRHIIYQVIFILASLQGLYLTFRPAGPEKQWPAELEKDRGAYCRLETYKSCREGAWFGIQRSALPQGNTGILSEICQGWKTPPDPAQQRLIDATNDDMLYLCRMKAPDKIEDAKLKAAH